MAFPALSSAISRIGDLLTEEATYLWGVEEQVERLQTELRWMQSFSSLKDADARQGEDERIRMWVAEIRELAYDAEDVVEAFALQVGSRRKGGFSNVIKRWACILNEGWLLHETRSKIESIIARIVDLTRRLQTYGIKELRDAQASSFSSVRRELRRSYSHIIDDDIVGLDNDIKTLVSVLVDEESECRVVSIWGMGGLGKTTLAKKVYHHHQVKEQFNRLAWVYVSQQCQRRNVWEGILSGFNIMDEEDRKNSDEKLAKKLFEFMKDTKCLVILDDIWSTEAWDRVKPAFPESETRSKILLTSRNKEVVSYADRRGYLYELQYLKEEESLELLKKIAFRGRDSADIATMEELAKDMVKHCAGLPLAVVVLGGILATKSSLPEWDMVFKNVKSHLKRGKSQGPEHVLASSYDDLPPYLRPCFLYLSHFPEDYEIHAQRLVQLWVAEGIVSSMQEDGGETTDDVAESYLVELAERCMIQVRQRDVTTLKIETFQMHDLMRDLCLSKAKQENFLFIVDQSNANSLSDIRGVRRVSAHQSFQIQHIKSSNLRSFLLFNDEFTQKGAWTYMIHNFKLLRVLDVERGANVWGSKLHSNIGKLIHLRFLSIKMKKLPSSLGNLRCLRTLDLRVLWVDVHVPDVIWRMEQLRHLYLPQFCSHKTKLKLGTLRNLQTLVNFNTKICYVEDLINMTNIRELEIRGSFTIVSRYGRIGPRHLTHLLSSCVSTCKLSLDVKISKLPEHHYFSSDMAYIHLEGCWLEEDPMPTLEKLPNLRILELENDAFIRKEMVCSAEGFPKLDSLRLNRLYNLEEWKVDEGAMPALRHLEIVGCSSLKMLPDGLRFLTTLQELKIKLMPKAFKDKVVEGGADYYKVKHVPSIIFQNCDHYPGGRIDPRHLTHLLSSCVSTCKLSLDVKISKLPEYHYFSSNMAYIHLEGCELQEDPMPTLEKLPNLRILKLGYEAFIGEELVCSAEGFPKLDSLSLKGLYNLKEWKVDEGAMPALRHLEIARCWSLQMLPNGLRFITTLQELNIESMLQAFIEKVVEGGADYYKVKHVPSIIS